MVMQPNANSLVGGSKPCRGKMAAAPQMTVARQGLNHRPKSRSRLHYHSIGVYLVTMDHFGLESPLLLRRTAILTLPRPRAGASR